jgi:putative transposase
VPTWGEVAYVCFIVDAFSRVIVGWRVAAHMRTTMVLDAIDLLRAVPVTVLKETRGAE